jgi:4-oxalmesaconate hydratase
MIIDCHGHYTTEPKDLLRWRKEQVDNVKEPAKQPSKSSLKVSDDEIRESLEGAQLKLQRERGTDLTIFSPRAMGMSHHIGDYNVSLGWSQVCNESARSIPTISSAYASCRSRRVCRRTAASGSSSGA